MPYINVDEAYILDNTGLQVDNSVDYANANSNRNLLDNPWWGSAEIVNQRGIASGVVPSSVYVMDRWKMAYFSGSGATYSINTDGLSITPPTGGYVQIMQDLFNPIRLNGKIITASMMLSDGTIEYGTITRTNGTDQTVVNTGSYGLAFYADNSFRVVVSAALTIRAVKVEFGAYSTLVNDSAPDYGQELEKCKYYFERIKARGNYAVFGVGVCANTTVASVLVPMHPKRNNSYTIATSGSFAILGATSVTALAKDNAATNCALNLAVTGTGFTSAGAALLRANNDSSAYIDVLNDL